MKWNFLIIAILSVVQGSLLAWNEWLQWRDFESMKTSPDGTTYLTKVSYVGSWPTMVALIISLVITSFCLRQFFRLNSIMPIHGRKLRILTRP
ncbi:hypothetical protein NT6N_14660 [Oceaniferula spumae]|uniref:Uncharacterized protein n=1 Tax=Oceaniferula spumae TaxID=2979115 RepID=A0AAT9FKB8_9BACT